VEVSAVPLEARAEAETPVLLGTEVRLDGRSSRGEGTLLFAWTLVARPPRSMAMIADANQRVARLQVDASGQYVIELSVGTDASRQVATAMLMVEAVSANAFIRGEITGEGEINITDPVRLLGWLFLGDSEPDCLDAADANDDASTDLTDAVHVLNHLFLGGRPPVLPFPECGLDPTVEGLGCARSPCP
jgi:hypothetical protein